MTVDFSPKNSRFFQKTVDFTRKQITKPSAARRNAERSEAKPTKGGVRGASPPGKFSNFAMKWSKSRPPWDFQGQFNVYKKWHFFNKNFEKFR